VPIESLTSPFIDPLITRISNLFTQFAQTNDAINPHLEVDTLRTTLQTLSDDVLISHRTGQLDGHLYGAVFEDDYLGRSAWISPDSASFDSTAILTSLLESLVPRWSERGADRISAWTFDLADLTATWRELGFVEMHRRAVRPLGHSAPRSLPEGYTLRRGSDGDFDTLVELDSELGRWQSPDDPQPTSREDLQEMILDPDVTHFIVERNEVPVAQCLTFSLPPRRGSHPQSAQLSDVVVRPSLHGVGIGSALVEQALHHAWSSGAKFAEVSWRVDNELAAHFWRRRGFQSTHVRLGRSIS
jgi:ribosomal protein S18 acetylase RimI-like enzyme